MSHFFRRGKQNIIIDLRTLNLCKFLKIKYNRFILPFIYVSLAILAWYKVEFWKFSKFKTLLIVYAGYDKYYILMIFAFHARLTSHYCVLSWLRILFKDAKQLRNLKNWRSLVDLSVYSWYFERFRKTSLNHKYCAIFFIVKICIDLKSITIS